MQQVQNFAGVQAHALQCIDVCRVKFGRRLRDPDGKVAVPGFFAELLQPDTAAKSRTSEISLPDASIALPGVSPHLPAPLEELRTRFIYEPSMSISGFWVDEAISHSIPASASARIRFGLVPMQNPEQIFALVAKYLHAQNPDIAVTLASSIKPAYSPVDTPFARAAVRAAEKAFAAKPVIYDVMTGAGPGAHFLEHLGAPIISHMHGYNEHGAVDDYLQHIQFTLQLLRELDVSGFASAS